MTMDLRSSPLPRLLWVNVRLLHPLNGGDRLRTYHMLRQLRRHARITYFCPQTAQDDPSACAQAAEYCDELITYPLKLKRSSSPAFYAAALANCIFGRLPFAAARYGNKQATQRLQSLLNEHRHDLAVADYLMSWVHFASLPKAPAIPTVVFEHNIESLIWQRHASNLRLGPRRWVCHREWQLTRRLEDQVAHEATGQIMVSAEEEAAFRNERGMRNVLGWVPTGVDCDAFVPSSCAEPCLAFLGSMDWQANVDAVLHFTREVLPRIRAKVPQVKLLLIGRNPTPAIRQLAQNHPGIEVTGTVADVRPHLSRSSIMILPLRVGGGTRIKVFEAMAAGLPIVSTSVGVEGLCTTDGEHVLIGDDSERFANQTLRLLQDASLRRSLAERARLWVKERFGWQQAADHFFGLIKPLLPQGPEAPPPPGSLP
jgi:sugar transferase (PEP-CTERM/EpsH1 system associated)